MTSLRVGRRRESWWIRGAAIAVVLLALGTAFCLFDQDDDGAIGHVTRPDLCLGLLAASIAIMPLAGLLAAGWAVILVIAAPQAAALNVPDPPPKAASHR